MINNIKKPNLLICVFFSIIFNVDGRKTVLSTDNVYKIVNLIIGVYIIINFHRLGMILLESTSNCLTLQIFHSTEESRVFDREVK